MDVEPVNNAPLIQFDQEERRGSRTQGNDALVIRALLANYEIEWGAPLEAVDTPLYGFAGEVVHPRGMISLPLTLEITPLRKTCLLKFLVLDIPSAYNVILGRPTLNAFRAIISTYHLKIKFLVIGGVGESPNDALQARKCYVEAIKIGKKRRTEESPKTVDPNKLRKDPISRPELDNETPAMVQPAEELFPI
ncbi:UNVERIFIED_CONTAM: hypothetical protein Sangu_0796200 [Sesamum angustifolium]|uniref:Uncharacterized protein n=1 Tax=Sesamum angustifolium TaxID=2727405 RepID=A0AAW2PVH1_9LAMI